MILLQLFLDSRLYPRKFDVCTAALKGFCFIMTSREVNSGRNAKIFKCSLLMELKLPRFTCGLRPSAYKTLTGNKRRVDTQSRATPRAIR